MDSKNHEKNRVRFIGGYGGAAGPDAVAFGIACLKNAKRLSAGNETAAAFLKALKASCPDLPERPARENWPGHFMPENEPGQGPLCLKKRTKQEERWKKYSIF